MNIVSCLNRSLPTGSPEFSDLLALYPYEESTLSRYALDAVGYYCTTRDVPPSEHVTIRVRERLIAYDEAEDVEYCERIVLLSTPKERGLLVLVEADGPPGHKVPSFDEMIAEARAQKFERAVKMGKGDARFAGMLSALGVFVLMAIFFHQIPENPATPVVIGAGVIAGAVCLASFTGYVTWRWITTVRTRALTRL